MATLCNYLNTLLHDILLKYEFYLDCLKSIDRILKMGHVAAVW